MSSLIFFTSFEVYRNVSELCPAATADLSKDVVPILIVLLGNEDKRYTDTQWYTRCGNTFIGIHTFVSVPIRNVIPKRITCV